MSYELFPKSLSRALTVLLVIGIVSVIAGLITIGIGIVSIIHKIFGG